jgi:hypothetical protein
MATADHSNSLEAIYTNQADTEEEKVEEPITNHLA